jgi:choline dehydrogenase
MSRKKNWTRREFLEKSAAASLGFALTASGCATLTRALRAPTNDKGEDVFDYIVVGSGAGGGPVAANLAKAGYRVLLLEAGGLDGGKDYSTPIFHGRSTEHERMAWNFFVKHYSDDAKNREDSKYDIQKGGILYPRAGTVGGCTAHNAMITLYPDNEDWDHIRDLTGDNSWNPLEMRGFYQRIENAKYRKESARNDSLTGYDGWLSVETAPLSILQKDSQLRNIVIAAAKRGGVLDETVLRFLSGKTNLSLDPNDWRYVKKKNDGIFRMPTATRNGVRNGTRELILDTIVDHPDKLTLRTHSFVTELVFDERETNRVIGVRYKEKVGGFMYRASPLADESSIRTATARVARATREVILAGGAFNTPQLLMLSGIGDPALLGRSTRIALPGVGKNLQDRYELGVVTRMPKDFDILEKCELGSKVDPCLDEYEKGSPGSPYRTNGVVVALIERSTSDKKSPDLCIFGVPGRFHGYFRGYSAEAFKKDQFTWAVLKGHTKNQSGSVTLKSKDPFDTPEINFRYYGDGSAEADQDLEDLLRGVKRARKINAKLMKEEVFPGKSVGSDDEIRQYIRRESWGHHASCTAKMGAANDEMAVVDSKFRVHKTKGLRIVDASVFPKIPGLFIVTPIYMVAEKASDDILSDARS